MKWHSVFYLSLLFLINCIQPSFSQGCLPDGIVFTTQSQIDSFPINYPSCTKILGNVTIEGGVNIINLNGLNHIDSISGDISIYSNSLSNFEGFDNLKWVGGGLAICCNSALSSFHGLENLLEVNHGLYVSNLDFCPDLNGLNQLRKIGGSIYIAHNFNLVSLHGLERLKIIGGDLIIGDEWFGNEVLNDVSALDSLTTIGGKIQILQNPALSVCNTNWLCKQLSDTLNGKIIVAFNGEGCNSVISVSMGCGGGMPCLPQGEYHFYSQQDIDDFQASFPNCSELQGTCSINYNVQNLNGLNNISKIYGTLIINSTQLNNLNGLNNLTTIGSGLVIFDNLYLMYLSGLENLTSINSYLNISYNQNLNSILGLNNLPTGSIDTLVFMNNSQLSECSLKSVCECLLSPDGLYLVANNSMGCNNASQVLDNCEVHIQLINSSGFEVVPNPANFIFVVNFQATTQKEMLQFSDIYGRKIDELPISKGQTSSAINCSSWPPGLYLGQLISEGHVIANCKVLVK